MRGMKITSDVEYPEVREAVSSNCQKIELSDTPDLQIIQSEKPHCFVFGLSKKSAKLVIATGCINMLSPEELDAMILHELSHIKGKDIGFKTVGMLLTKLAVYPLSFLLLVACILLFIYVTLACLGGRLYDPAVRFYFGYVIEILVLFAIGIVFFPQLIIRHSLELRELVADARTICVIEKESLVSAMKKIVKRLYLMSLIQRRFHERHRFRRSLKILGFFSTSFLHPTIHLGPRINAIERGEFIAREGRVFLPSARTSFLIGIAMVYSSLPLFLLETWNLVLRRFPPSSIGFFIYVLFPAFLGSVGNYLILRNSDYAILGIRHWIELAVKLLVTMASFLIFATLIRAQFGLSGGFPPLTKAPLDMLSTLKVRLCIFLMPSLAFSFITILVLLLVEKRCRFAYKTHFAM
jgi:Zn-dependent protease with chaperone function